MSTKEQIEDIVDAIKESLGMTSKAIFGLDIGSSSVKMAELVQAGSTFKLVRYTSLPLPEGCLIEDEIQKEEEIIAAIEECLEVSGITYKNVCIGLSGPNTLARRLQLAGGSDEEIEDQVSWEAEQYLPFNIEDSRVSYHLIGENEGGGVDVLIAAAKLDVIDSFKGLVAEAGLKAKVVDLDLIALTNIIEHVLDDELLIPDTSWIFMDIGAQKTGFLIYRNETIVFSKEIPIGGVMITEEIQRQMGVNYEQAEDLKINGDSNGNLPEEIIEIIDSVNEAFFTEVRKTLDFYITSSSDDSIAECYITGGGSVVPGLQEGLQGLLGIAVNQFNPFDRLAFGNFSDDEITEIAYRGSVTLGLALRFMKHGK